MPLIRHTRMKRKIKSIVFFIGLFFLLTQFFNPEKNQSTITPATDFISIELPDDSMALVIDNACYDCHSNNTKYPWYDRITPINFWVEDHVSHGKKHLDFSLWDTYSDKKKAHKLEECIEMLEEHEMPLKSYSFMHREARLDKKTSDKLIVWLESLKLKYDLAETVH